MFTYIILFNIVGFFAIIKSYRFKYFILLIFNLLIVFTYGLKPILSCSGYYVIYTGCIDSPALIIIFFTLMPFFLAQFISISPAKISIKLAKSHMTFGNTFAPLAMLGALIIFTQAGSETSVGNGFKSLMISTFITLIIISVRYKNFYSVLLVGIFAFLASGTKQLLLFPLILYFSSRFNKDWPLLNTFKLMILVLGSLITAQLFRSQGNFDLSNSDFLFLLAIPFDAFDNAVTIINDLYHENYTLLLVPGDILYFAESFLNYVPRAIWAEKPEVQGFWRIQRDYLPNLYSGTNGMSVSTSLPVDILLNFGLPLGSILLFITARFLKNVDLNSIHLGYMYPFIVIFAVEFSRGGFRNFWFVILQLIATIILIKIISLVLSPLRSRHRL